MHFAQAIFTLEALTLSSPWGWIPPRHEKTRENASSARGFFKKKLEIIYQHYRNNLRQTAEIHFKHSNISY